PRARDDVVVHRGKARFPLPGRDQLPRRRAVVGGVELAAAPGGWGALSTGLALVLTCGLALVLSTGLALVIGVGLRLVAPGATRLSLVWRGAIAVGVAVGVGVVCTFTALVIAGAVGAAVAPAPACCCCWICAARLGGLVVAGPVARPPTWVPPSGVGTRPPIRVKPICSAVGV